MASTNTVVKKGIPGDVHYAILSLTGDASYPAGGYAVDVTALGVPTQRFLAIPNGGNMTAAAVSDFFWNDATQKVQFFASPGVEVTPATNVSAYNVVFYFLGY